jgi:hypothetical protein
VNAFESFLEKHRELFALLMLTLSVANAYLAYTHRGAPLRVLFDIFFAIFGFALFVLTMLFAKKTKRGGDSQ